MKTMASQAKTVFKNAYFNKDYSCHACVSHLGLQVLSSLSSNISPIEVLCICPLNLSCACFALTEPYRVYILPAAV